MLYISGLRDRLKYTSAYLEMPAPADDPVELAAKKAVIPSVEALAEDFNNRWGDGKIVLIYREGERRQTQRLRQEQVKAAALVPRTK